MFLHDTGIRRYVIFRISGVLSMEYGAWSIFIQIDLIAQKLAYYKLWPLKFS